MVREINVKSILNKKKNRDSWFLDDYTLNPYEGCSFNCQYCYIRGSKYGENMAEQLSAKINGPQVLDRQLMFRVRKQQYGMIALASATDPYIKAEEHYKLSRQFLQHILAHRFPVMMITKSEGILRDLDLLTAIDKSAIHASDLQSSLKRGVYISFSLSTLDGGIAATLEPGAPLPVHRLETMQKCKSAGLRVGVNCIPALPFISDDEVQLDRMVEAAKDYGADYIFIGGLTLFGTDAAASRTLYFKFLERRFPDLAQRYKNLYGNFFSPPKRYLHDLEKRADKICLKHKIKRTILEP
jgi:DNA repair photolyase